MVTIHIRISTMNKHGKNQSGELASQYPISILIKGFVWLDCRVDCIGINEDITAKTPILINAQMKKGTNNAMAFFLRNVLMSSTSPWNVTPERKKNSGT